MLADRLETFPEIDDIEISVGRELHKTNYLQFKNK